MAMTLEATLNGSYPRSEEVAKLYSKYLSGKISNEEFDRGIDNAIQNLFKLLRNAGIKVITDGMLRWDDIFNPLIRFVDGVEVNGLTRFYDNNFFFRAPIIKGKLRLRSDNPLTEWFSGSLALASRVFDGDVILKQPLPGPLTLATNSVNNHYTDFTDLLHDWCVEVLEPLVKLLASRGLRVIEVHEPSLVWRGTKLEVIKAGVKEISEFIEFNKRLGIDTWVLTYFGTPRRLGNLVSELSEAVLGIDYHTKEKGKVQLIIKDYGLKRVMIGIINARNTLMESKDRIRYAVRKAFEYGAKEVYVGNNAPMDFIPEVVASRKLRKLGKVISKIASEGV